MPKPVWRGCFGRVRVHLPVCQSQERHQSTRTVGLDRTAARLRRGISASGTPGRNSGTVQFDRASGVLGCSGVPFSVLSGERTPLGAEALRVWIAAEPGQSPGEASLMDRPSVVADLFAPCQRVAMHHVLQSRGMLSTFVGFVKNLFRFARPSWHGRLSWGTPLDGDRSRELGTLVES